MALDGITIASVVHEMAERLPGGRISRIAQPEADELVLTVNQQKNQWKLFISAGASLPLIYFTEKSKPNPQTAPNFCMLLRKHIGNGRILSVTQPGLERIVRIEIEHLDELGDLRRKYLIAEIMGKHSNIIFTDENDRIIDSIKRISSQVSSVREVLPGRDYFIAVTAEKADPLTASVQDIRERLLASPITAGKALYQSFTGISPIMAEELCFRAGADPDVPASEMPEAVLTALAEALADAMEAVKAGDFSPNIVYRAGEPVEFAAVPLTVYQSLDVRRYDSISEVLESYYAEKNLITRVRQRSADLRRITDTAIERTSKKYDLQLKQLKDTEKRERYRLYGELLRAYGYGLEEGQTSAVLPNFYDDNKEITVPLDKDLTAQENATKYFDRYQKLRRTYEALTELTQQTADDLTHLQSVRTSLDIAQTEDDLAQIREELQESGYIKKAPQDRKKKKTVSRPLHFISSDEFDMYVGKNNLQNEELTFSLASGNDWWFHAKGIPGSHVIVKTGGREMTDRAFEEAGALAAHYSSAGKSDRVEIDYIQKKHIKKPAGGRPGFVIYHTNFSLIAGTDISSLREV